MIRTFAVANLDDRYVVHDPASNITRACPTVLPPGRRRLDDTDVSAWPVLAPAHTSGGAPVHVCWSPIVRCNLTCSYCIDDKSVSEVPPTERARVADVLAASTVLSVDISGGEPLLLPDLSDLARLLAAGGRAVSCTTNGWHLARRARELANCLDAIRVSLDGATAVDHDARRGAGSFKRAVEGIRAATAAGLFVQIQTVLMRTTAPHAQAFADLAGQLGAGGISFLQYLPFGEGAANADAHLLSDDHARAVIGQVRPPQGVQVRLRTRGESAGFAVVRADGTVWRNDHRAMSITPGVALRTPADLTSTDSRTR
ncbi:radical SAM protein [Embleya sp. NPDC059237]|uniref:radical SAM protein n=1 Tax=Embleya sp. NPDC059237 TaxID=3346784 RepID=UPI0036A3DE43